MLQDRANTNITTIDPGQTWNELDKNAIMPSENILPVNQIENLKCLKL